MNISPFDVVVLTQDMDEYALKKGMKGTVLDVYDHPTEGYEVEFCDEAGRTIVNVGIPAHALIRYQSS
jgi:hypothetical protein